MLYGWLQFHQYSKSVDALLPTIEAEPDVWRDGMLTFN